MADELTIGADGFVDMDAIEDVDPELALEPDAMAGLREALLGSPVPEPDAGTWASLFEDAMADELDAELADDLVPSQVDPAGGPFDAGAAFGGDGFGDDGSGDDGYDDAFDDDGALDLDDRADDADAGDDVGPGVGDADDVLADGGAGGFDDVLAGFDDAPELAATPHDAGDADLGAFADVGADDLDLDLGEADADDLSSTSFLHDDGSDR